MRVGYTEDAPRVSPLRRGGAISVPVSPLAMRALAGSRRWLAVHRCCRGSREHARRDDRIDRRCYSESSPHVGKNRIDSGKSAAIRRACHSVHDRIHGQARSARNTARGDSGRSHGLLHGAWLRRNLYRRHRRPIRPAQKCCLRALRWKSRDSKCASCSLVRAPFGVGVIGVRSRCALVRFGHEPAAAGEPPSPRAGNLARRCRVLAPSG